jgi:hypothetical protein
MRVFVLVLLILTMSADSFAKGAKPPKPPNPPSGGGSNSSLDPQSFSAPAGSIIYNTRSAMIESSYRISSGDAKFYGNLAVSSLMGEFVDPARNILGVLAAYRDCRSKFPLDGQLRATGSINISSVTIPSVRTEWVASRSMACFRGAYAGFLSSNDLGAYSISFSSTRSVGGTVCLTETAAANVVIQLESYSTTVATVPASVTIPRGARCANYVVNVVGPFDTYIHAKLNGYWISKMLSVGP